MVLIYPFSPASRPVTFCGKRNVQTKIQKVNDYFLLKLFTYGNYKKADETKDKEEFTLAEVSSAYHRSQTKCQLVQTSYIKGIKFFLFANKYLINRDSSVCMGDS